MKKREDHDEKANRVTILDPISVKNALSEVEEQVTEELDIGSQQADSNSADKDISLSLDAPLLETTPAPKN